MIEAYQVSAPGFSTVVSGPRWKVAFVSPAPQYGRLTLWKRHMETDEVFVLLKGSATLYTLDQPGKIQCTPLQPETLYNVKAVTWHHLQVSSDGLLAMVENCDTTTQNTQSRPYCPEDGPIPYEKGE